MSERPVASAARRRSRVAAFALTYFAVQVGVPAVIFMHHTAEVPTDFSWDMFSYRVECPTLIAGAVPENGRPRRLALEDVFARSAQLRRVLYPERIEALARYLCPKIQGAGAGHVELRLWIECRFAPDGPTLPITNRSRDYCAGP